MGLRSVVSRAIYHIRHYDCAPLDLLLLRRPGTVLSAALPIVAYVVTVYLVTPSSALALDETWSKENGDEGGSEFLDDAAAAAAAARRRKQRPGPGPRQRLGSKKTDDPAALQATAQTLLSQFVTNILLSLVLEPLAPTLPQILLGMFLLDTAEYFCHRAMHMNRSLYAAAHSTHHSLPMSPSLALYNAATEAGLTGAAIFVTMAMTDVGYQSFIVVTTMANVKTVWDHSVYSHHHYMHHERPDCNYEQPFWDVWDRVLGTKCKGEEGERQSLSYKAKIQ